MAAYEPDRRRARDDATTLSSSRGSRSSRRGGASRRRARSDNNPLTQRSLRTLDPERRVANADVAHAKADRVVSSWLGEQQQATDESHADTSAKSFMARLLSEDFSSKVSRSSVSRLATLLVARVKTPADAAAVVAAIDERMRDDVELNPKRLLCDFYVFDAVLKLWRRGDPALHATVCGTAKKLLREYAPWTARSEVLQPYLRMVETWRTVVPEPLMRDIRALVDASQVQ